MAAMLLLASASLVGAQDREPAATDVQIRAIEDELIHAIQRRDRRLLEELLAPDYSLRGDPDLSRDTWIQNAVTLCWGDRFDIDQFRVRQLGTIAVTSYQLTFYVDPGTCRRAVLRSLITDVWTMTASGWQLQVRHASPPPRPDAGVVTQYGIVPQPPPTWDIGSELSLVATAGTTSTRTIGAAASVLHQQGRATTRGAFAFVSSESGGITQAQSVNTQGRQGFRTSPRTELFTLGSYARDRFAGIENRWTAEGGVAYTAPLPRPHALTTEARAGFTAEQRLDATDLRFATGTGAFRYSWRLRPGAELTEDGGLIADLTRAANWRITSTTAVTVTLTQLLSLKASHALEYRKTPVVGFGRTDMRTSLALVITYQRRPTPP
jgi:putative salt-induced outer membrane protein YdiY